MSRRSKIIDAFPNYMGIALTMSAANTFTTVSRELPISRVGSGTSTRATIIELLWAEVEFGATDLIADGDEVTLSVSIGSTPTAATFWNQSQTLFRIRVDQNLLTSGTFPIKYPLKVDMQSKDGYGLLVASDNLHISMESTGQAAACVLTGRIYYRFVDVPLTEWVGLVQSVTS